MREGWRKTSVGAILQLEYGKPLSPADRDVNGRYPVYGANGQIGRSNRYYHDVPSIIVGRKGSAGELNLSEGRFWPLDVTYFVTFDDQKYDLRFLYYLLATLELTSLAKGIKPGINRNEVYSQQVAVAPLLEQRRIVRVLDEAFEGIAAASMNAERNCHNAVTLLESHLQSVFTRRRAGWVESGKPLAELCEFIVDCEHKTAPTQDEGVPSIRTSNIGKGRLLLEDVNRVSEATYLAWTRRAEPMAGDLILAREAPAGNVAVIPENTRVCLGQRTVLIRPRADIVDPSFLAWRLLEPQTQKKLLAHSRGATVQHVNMKDIRALDIGAIPSLSVQRDIAARLNAVALEGERLASLYRQKLALLGTLKKSLLQMAFCGDV